jgi:hypothetical protein
MTIAGRGCYTLSVLILPLSFFENPSFDIGKSIANFSLCRLLVFIHATVTTRRNLMQVQSRTQTENCILARLPAEDYERLLPHLESVELKHGKVLTESGGRMDYAYFPNNSMISLISHTPDGESVEVGIVGFEGMANISLILGVDKSPHEAMVQIPDSAMRIKTQDLRDEFKRGGALHDILLRYTQGRAGC